jgi:Flp pilus assembly pilin Flp
MAVSVRGRDGGSVTVEQALLLVFILVAAVAGVAALGGAVVGLFVVPGIGVPSDGAH